jgi:hypothetical protein
MVYPPDSISFAQGDCQRLTRSGGRTEKHYWTDIAAAAHRYRMPLDVSRFGKSTSEATCLFDAISLRLPVKFLDWLFVGRSQVLAVVLTIVSVMSKPKTGESRERIAGK